MTEEQRQEAISREFLRLLAHSNGFKIVEPPLDHGVDMIVCPVSERIEPDGKRRFLDSQFKLDFQIKSTTVTGIIEDEDSLRYDLEAKTYNDLVQRRGDILPLHLIVVVLSEAPPACVAIDHERIWVIGSAFWFLPEEDAEPTENNNTKRITIPKANRLGAEFVRSCYQRLEIEV